MCREHDLYLFGLMLHTCTAQFGLKLQDDDCAGLQGFRAVLLGFGLGFRLHASSGFVGFRVEGSTDVRVYFGTGARSWQA